GLPAGAPPAGFAGSSGGDAYLEARRPRAAELGSVARSASPGIVNVAFPVPEGVRRNGTSGGTGRAALSPSSGRRAAPAERGGSGADARGDAVVLVAGHRRDGPRRRAPAATPLSRIRGAGGRPRAAPRSRPRRARQQAATRRSPTRGRP